MVHLKGRQYIKIQSLFVASLFNFFLLLLFLLSYLSLHSAVGALFHVRTETRRIWTLAVNGSQEIVNHRFLQGATSVHHLSARGSPASNGRSVNPLPLLLITTSLKPGYHLHLIQLIFRNNDWLKGSCISDEEMILWNCNGPRNAVVSCPWNGLAIRVVQERGCSLRKFCAMWDRRHSVH